MKDLGGDTILKRVIWFPIGNTLIKLILVAVFFTATIGYLLSFHPIFALGLLFVLLFVVFSLIKPRIMFYIAIASVAFYNIGVLHFGMVDLRPFQFLWLVIFVSVSIHILVRREPLLPDLGVMIPLLLFIVANLLSLRTSQVRLVTVRETLQVVYLIMVFIMVSRMNRSRQEISKSVNVIFIITAVFVTFGLFSIIWDVSPIPQVVMNVENGIRVEFRQSSLITHYTFDNFSMQRVSSFFLGPVGTASFLVQILVLLLALIIGNHLSTGKKILFFTLICISLPVFVTTFSRAGWLIFALSIIALVFSARGGARIILFIMFLSIVGITIFHIPTRMRLLELITNPIYEPSIRGHFALYIASFRAFLKNPFYGIGAGLFPFRILEQGYIFRALGIPVMSIDVHNMFLQTAAEIGIIGLISLLWFVIVVLKRLFNAIILEPAGYHRDIMIGLSIACIASIFMNMTMNAFKIETFFIIFGLAHAATRVVIEDSRTSRECL